MLPARIAAWFKPGPQAPEPVDGRPAYHSDIRELRPESWSRRSPAAQGSDVERALWLAGVSSRDFAEVVDIDISPHLVAPVDDIVDICLRRSEACAHQAAELSAELPAPNSFGRPPLPWHRGLTRDAERLYRASQAWEALARALLSNRWHP